MVPHSALPVSSLVQSHSVKVHTGLTGGQHYGLSCLFLSFTTCWLLPCGSKQLFCGLHRGHEYICVKVQYLKVRLALKV